VYQLPEPSEERFREKNLTVIYRETDPLDSCKTCPTSRVAPLPERTEGLQALFRGNVQSTAGSSLDLGSNIGR